MLAQAQSFTFLGSEKAVKIPFFQRSYVWTKTNWEDLLTDLLDTNKSHFLGSLILKQQPRQTGKPQEVLVIDGQQRLTTLSVLLKAIYDLFPEATQKNCKTSFDNCIFYKLNETDEKQFVKICHSRLDAQVYQRVIQPGIAEAELAAIDESSNRILQCYKYFYEELKARPTPQVSGLYNRLLDRDNKLLVLIDLTEREDEQAIFDTINSAGVRLSAADIVKNALFQRALDVLSDSDEVLKLYSEKWDEVFAADDDTTAFWECPRSTGRLMRDNIEILLHSVAVIGGFFDPDRHTLSDLSTLYKAHIAHMPEKQLKGFISDIAEYADLFREKISSPDNAAQFAYAADLQRLLHILDVLETTTFHPFILCQLKKHKTNEAQLNQVLKKLESLVMRRMITRTETKSYNKLCKEFIGDETLIEGKRAEIANDAIEQGLQKISNKNAALVLFWIELFRRHSDAKFGEKELKYSYSLEHVMPQKWEEFWKVVPVKNAKGAIIIATEEAKKEREARIYSLGNMTLLTSSLNTSLRNYSFEKKMAGDGRKKGMKYYASLSIFKSDIEAAFDSGDHVWDEVKIANRTESLKKEVLALW